MMFAVSPSLDWKSQSSLQSPVLAFKFLFQQLDCPVLKLSDTRFHQCLILRTLKHLCSEFLSDTTLDHTCFFHCCINYFILFSPYRKISWYWHLCSHNHVILMGTSCSLSKSPQLKQLNSSCNTQSSFLRPFNFKVNNEVGSKTDPRGALKMNQWERNENHVNYKWNCRGKQIISCFFFSLLFLVIVTVVISCKL